MPLEIVRNDITKMHVDAIVNAANPSLLGGGGVDGSIHRAAGPGLLAECQTLNGCATGDAKITGAYDLPCKYVIHAVGPRWNGGSYGEAEKLASCYSRSLALAEQHGCESVAFPLISSGIYGYPKEEALQIAVDQIRAFLTEHDMTVYIVVFDRYSFLIGEARFRDIAQYIDDRYVDANTDPIRERMRRENLLDCNANADYFEDADLNAPSALDAPAIEEVESSKANQPHILRSVQDLPTAPLPRSLDDALMQLDESFSEMLLRLIDERGMTDAQCYKKANIDRKLFSKIRSDKLYKPSKPTVLAFAIALELPIEQAQDMLKRAGFALSHSSKFDIIVEYFINRGEYDIYAINEALFAFDQSLLGAHS